MFRRRKKQEPPPPPPIKIEPRKASLREAVGRYDITVEVDEDGKCAVRLYDTRTYMFSNSLHGVTPEELTHLGGITKDMERQCRVLLGLRNFEPLPGR